MVLVRTQSTHFSEFIVRNSCHEVFRSSRVLMFYWSLFFLKPGSGTRVTGPWKLLFGFLFLAYISSIPKKLKESLNTFNDEAPKQKEYYLVKYERKPPANVLEN